MAHCVQQAGQSAKLIRCHPILLVAVWLLPLSTRLSACRGLASARGSTTRPSTQCAPSARLLAQQSLTSWWRARPARETVRGRRGPRDPQGSKQLEAKQAQGQATLPALSTTLLCSPRHPRHPNQTLLSSKTALSPAPSTIRSRSLRRRSPPWSPPGSSTRMGEVKEMLDKQVNQEKDAVTELRKQAR